MSGGCSVLELESAALALFLLLWSPLVVIWLLLALLFLFSTAMTVRGEEGLSSLGGVTGGAGIEGFGVVVEEGLV